MDKPPEGQNERTTENASSGTVGAKSLVGQVIGKKYKVVEQIGAGAMGAVFKAEHTWMDRIVALKVLHTHLVHSDTSLKRFQNEARTASKIAHPNAVTLYDFGIDGDLPYLAMRFAAGRTLKHVLKEDGALPLERVTTILSQVGGALAEAHSLGIIHRDLKPDNIMVSTSSTGEDWAEVLDFGIAKVTTSVDDGNVVTQTGMVIGTPQYMSPEQASGKQLDIRSDIYSLGVILYEMLSGEVPFSAGSLMEVLMAQINEKPTPLRKANQEIEIPKEIERVVMKALEKDPERRQTTVAELIQEFLSARNDFERRQNVSYKKRLVIAGSVLALAAAGGTALVLTRITPETPLEQMAESTFGQISIDSKPTGAQVYITGELRGVTPLLVTDVNPGEYRVTLQKAGYLDRSHTLEVTQGMTTQATFPLKQEATMLAAAASPVPTPAPSAIPEKPRLSEEERLAAVQALQNLEAEARAAQQQEAVIESPEPVAQPTESPAIIETVQPPEVTPTVAPLAEATEAPTPEPTAVASPQPQQLSPVEEELRLKEAARSGTTIEATPLPLPTEEPIPAPSPEAEVEEAIVIVQKPTALSKKSETINVAALDTKPQSPATPKALFDEAQRLFKQGQTNQATLKLEELVKKSPRMADARILLGRCYLKEAARQSSPALRNRKATSALKEFTEAFRSRPGSAEIRYNKAIAFAVMRNRRKVIQELQFAIRNNPSIRARAKKDPNFSWLKSDEQFQNL